VCGIFLQEYVAELFFELAQLPLALQRRFKYATFGLLLKMKYCKCVIIINRNSVVPVLFVSTVYLWPTKACTNRVVRCMILFYL